jgi:hypothetical protein
VIDFTLKPKTKDTLFDSLRLSFRNGLVNDMQLIDSVGQRTNILFTGVKANEPCRRRSSSSTSRRVRTLSRNKPNTLPEQPAAMGEE